MVCMNFRFHRLQFIWSKSSSRSWELSVLAQWKLSWQFTERWYVLVRSNCKLSLLVAFSVLNMSLKVLVANCWNVVAYFLKLQCMITTFLFTDSYVILYNIVRLTLSNYKFNLSYDSFFKLSIRSSRLWSLATLK